MARKLQHGNVNRRSKRTWSHRPSLKPSPKFCVGVDVRLRLCVLVMDIALVLRVLVLVLDVALVLLVLGCYSWYSYPCAMVFVFVFMSMFVCIVYCPRVLVPLILLLNVFLGFRLCSCPASRMRRVPLPHSRAGVAGGKAAAEDRKHRC